MKVEFHFEMKEGNGYRKCMKTEETTEIKITVEESSYANARRMIEPLINWDHVEHYGDICVD